MTLVLASTLLLAATAHVALGDRHEPRSRLISIGTAAVYPPRPDAPCPGSRRAIRYYRAAYTEHRATMRLPGAPPLVQGGCNTARTMAKKWRDLAHRARVAAARWLRLEYAAPPEPFLSIARCEQPSEHGLHGIQWDAYSESYEGAYGFAHTTWDGYKPAGYPENANQATPRQQLVVARILVRVFGGYSSWPACHVRLGLPG